jgi:hypothetical protein
MYGLARDVDRLRGGLRTVCTFLRCDATFIRSDAGANASPLLICLHDRNPPIAQHTLP